DRGGRNSSITCPSKYQHLDSHFARVRWNSEIIVADEVEKVTLLYDEVDEQPCEYDGAQADATDGALALLPADTATANTAEEATPRAECAQAWGISIPADFTPATKAQVAYWRELCGAISLTGKDGMRDTDWPTDLAPAKPTVQTMADRGLIARRRRAWHLK